MSDPLLSPQSFPLPTLQCHTKRLRTVTCSGKAIASPKSYPLTLNPTSSAKGPTVPVSRKCHWFTSHTAPWLSRSLNPSSRYASLSIRSETPGFSSMRIRPKRRTQDEPDIRRADHRHVFDRPRRQDWSSGPGRSRWTHRPRRPRWTYRLTRSDALSRAWTTRSAQEGLIRRWFTLWRRPGRIGGRQAASSNQGCHAGSASSDSHRRPEPTRLGLPGSNARCQPISDSRRSAFRALHLAQQATQFSHECAPPRLRGITWSIVSPPPLQYAHLFRSRRRIPDLVTAAAGRYGMRT